MKKLSALFLIAMVFCGCSSPISKMGKDTYLISRRGSMFSTVGSLRIKCLKEANRFCDKRGLAMVAVSTSGRNGAAGVVGSCELVFLAVPPDDPRNVPPDVLKDSDEIIEYRQRRLGDKP